MPDETYKTIYLQVRKPYYENYLRYVFDIDDGPIKVKRDEELGKYLFSRVRFSDVPVAKPHGQVVSLILPAHGCDSSRYQFLYFSTEDMVRINDYIDSSAYLDFRMMVQTGTVDLKMDRKTVISAFSDLIFGEDKFEMLKKDEYRKRKKLKEWLKKSAKAFCF